MSEPTYPQDWTRAADRKATELLEKYNIVTVTADDRDRLVNIVSLSYLSGRRDAAKSIMDDLSGVGI